jgi:hypothetical protein
MDIVNDIIFSRDWEMPNSKTFDIRVINKLIQKYNKEEYYSIDPFANKNRIAKVTNDLDPSMGTDYNLDALDFLKLFPDESVDFVLYDPPYCYDKETEVFTKDGWKLFDDLKNTDLIATLNPNTNKLEYHQPTEIIKKPYNGDMVKIKSQSVDLLVTPNHKMWVKNTFNCEFKFNDAHNILDNRVTWFKKAVDYDDDNEIEYFTLPEIELIKPNRYGEKQKPPKKIKMDTWLKFFGFYLSEGCVKYSENNKHKYIVDIAQKKEHIRKIIIDVLNELGYNYSIQKNQFRIQDKQLWTYLEKFGKSFDKYIPDEIKNISNRQREILLEHLMYGDGTNIKYPKLNKLVNKEYHYYTNIYYTSSPKLMNDISELAIKTNRAITIREDKKDNYNVVYRIHFLKAKNFRVYKKNIEIINNFNDNIYCVTVPNNIILVKRKGKTVWCGNSVRQVSECYKKFDRTVNKETTQSSFWSNLKKEIKRITKKDGLVLSFGWNSNGIGKTNGFKLIEIKLVSHGGPHNDTICTVEQKIK